MVYEIYNRPIAPQGRRVQAMKYPIKQLQIGQSFCVPITEEGEVRAAAAYVNARFHKWGIYVSVQKIDGLVWCGRCDPPTERIVYRIKT